MDAINLVGNLATLGVTLCAVLVVTLIPCFIISIPGWLTGRIAASNAPQVKRVRKTSTYWLTWVFLGGVPATASLVGGPLSTIRQFFATPVAIILGIAGILILNISAFYIGYKQGVTAKAKKAVRKGIEEGLGASAGQGVVETLGEGHPAASPPVATTRPLPVVAEEAPTQEIRVPNTDLSDDEYPLAQPHGE